MGAKKKKGNKKGNKKTNGMYGSEQDEDEEVNQDEYFSNSDGYDSDGEPKAKKISMYVKYTKYTCVKDAAKHFVDFHLSKRAASDWDVAWSDSPVNIQFLKEMKPWQRCNHFPGMYNLARKNMLGRHLMRM
jgi:tubulin polyglutamylase TTLL6/13